MLVQVHTILAPPVQQELRTINVLPARNPSYTTENAGTLVRMATGPNPLTGPATNAILVVVQVPTLVLHAQPHPITTVVRAIHHITCTEDNVWHHVLQVTIGFQMSATNAILVV